MENRTKRNQTSHRMTLSFKEIKEKHCTKTKAYHTYKYIWSNRNKNDIFYKAQSTGTIRKLINLKNELNHRSKKKENKIKENIKFKLKEVRMTTIND